MLAAAEGQGISRDKILGILWAETGEEQARHTLSQHLYALRREFGRDCIVGTAQLRLHSSIGSDVAEFRAALSARELEKAAALYAGPFLDGFYLAGAPEFERWVEEERARLHSVAVTAVESLARRAAEAGSHPEEIGWWRRLHQVDPYHAGHAAGLMRALIAAGDRFGALRFAQDYEARLHRDLDSEPDPVLRDLVASLRASRAAVEPDRVHPSPPASPRPLDRPDGLPVAAVPVVPRAADRRKVGRVPLVVGFGVALALLTAGWQLSRSLMRSSDPSLFLAVGTIRTTATSVSGPVLRDMLATNLARVRGVQVLANSRLLELVPAGADSIPRAMTDGARRAGAGEIIEGELVAGAGGLVLSLRRIAIRSGVLRRGYTVRAADRYALVDSATAVIARDLRLEPPGGSVAAVRTASPAAYALYEEGLRAYHQQDGPGAYRLMNAALDRDSTFAMAAYYVWRVGWAVGRYQEALRALSLAKRLAGRTTDQERLVIQAAVAGSEAPVSEYLDVAKELTGRFPDDPEGQITLGLARFANGEWAASVAALERAVAIDSAAGATGAPYCRICAAMIAMSETFIWWDSAGAAERTGRRLIALRPTEGAGWGSLVESLLRQDRWTEAQAAIVKADQLGLVRGNFGPALDRGLIRSGRFTELDVKLQSDLRNAASGGQGEPLWLLTISLRNQGRLREARDLALRRGVPGTSIRLAGPPDRLSLAIIALEQDQPLESSRGFLEVAAADRSGAEPIGYKSRVLAWHLTLAGTALAAAGDTAAVRRLADSVERIGGSSVTGRDARLHHFLRGLLYRQQGRQAEAVEAFRRSLFSLTDGFTRTNLEMARSLMALRRYPEAIAVLRPALRGGIDGSNTYVTHTELHEALAQAFEQAGQIDSAAVHYRAVERAWRWADPQFEARYRVARDRAGSSDSGS